LEGILAVVVVAKNATADAPDHGTMSAHQGFQCHRLLTADKGFEKLSVSQVIPVAQHCGNAKVLDDAAYAAARHPDPL
jgi:hypothetical protein